MNAFEALADAQTPAPVKRKLDAAERRRVKARQAEQELKDEQVLSKLYRQWKRKKRDALLAGPHGREVKGIVAFLETMDLSSAPALIRVVSQSRFIETMTKDERHDLFGIIQVGIRRCREKAGLQPYDDEIPFAGEPPKAVTQIKTLMRVS